MHKNWTKDLNLKQVRKKKRIGWATPFKNLIKLSNPESQLKPEASIVYKNPPTLAMKLAKYKQLAHKETILPSPGSFACKNCTLCRDHRGKTNMVKTTNQIR